MNVGAGATEPSLFVPFTMEPEGIIALHESRGEANFRRFLERWACLGVLMVESETDYRERLKGLLGADASRGPSGVLRELRLQLGKGYPVCETVLDQPVHELDPARWERSPLGGVFTAVISARGGEVQRLLEPALRVFDAMLLIDGYLAAPAQRQSLGVLGSILSRMGTRVIEGWCVHSSHFDSKNRRARLTPQSAEETWRRIARALRDGGAPLKIKLSLDVYDAESFSSRTHDRLLVLGNRRSIGSVPAENRHQRVVALGPGIRALCASRDGRKDTASRLDAASFERLREHFGGLERPPESISRKLNAL